MLPLTSAPQDAPLLRVRVEPTPENGLRAPSWVMIDKPATVPADKLGAAFGRLDDATMVGVSRSLSLLLDLAG